MNNHTRSSFGGLLSWMLPALMLAMIIALTFSSPVAHAAAPRADVALAQVAAPAPSVTVAAPVPFYATEAFWATVLAVVSGLFGIWKNRQASTHQKINESLVLGIEQATKIPEVVAFESRIKKTIQASATGYGVQPLLHRIVQDLTEPAATANGSSV
jgi:hypothetical protein